MVNEPSVFEPLKFYCIGATGYRESQKICNHKKLTQSNPRSHTQNLKDKKRTHKLRNFTKDMHGN